MSTLTLTKIIFILTVLSYTKSTGKAKTPKVAFQEQDVVLQQPEGLDVNAVVNENANGKIKSLTSLKPDLTETKNLISLIQSISPEIMGSADVEDKKYRKFMSNGNKIEYEYFTQNIVDYYTFQLHYEINGKKDLCGFSFSIYKNGDISANFGFLQNAISCVIDYQNLIDFGKKEKDKKQPSPVVQQAPDLNVNALVEEHEYPGYIDSSYFYTSKGQKNSKIANDFLEILSRKSTSKGNLLEGKSMGNSFKTKIVYNNGHIVDFYSIYLYYEQSSDECWLIFSVYRGGDILRNREFIESSERCISEYNFKKQYFGMILI